MTELTDEQKKQVSAWVAAGASLADIQRRLREELALTLTYMETRFLVDDLQLKLVDKEPDETKPKDSDKASSSPLDEENSKPAAGAVRVTIDQVTAPHALVSGKVTFSDGQVASWMLDQMGRLALDPQSIGYRPSEQDIIAFQQELQRVAQQQGF